MECWRGLGGPLAGVVFVVELHSALFSALFGSQGCSALQPWICYGQGVLPSLWAPRAGSSHPRAACPRALARTGTMVNAWPSSCHSCHPVCQGQLWSLLSSPHRRPGPRAGPTPTTLPSGRAAWTLLPAGLAICRWSTRRWGSTLSSLKTRSPSWGRSTETLNASEDAAERAEPPSPVWEPDCAAGSERRPRQRVPVPGPPLRTAPPPAGCCPRD